MKKGSLLMDLTSLKKKPVEAMIKYVPQDVEFLGTHPMFGPSIPSLQGQTFILTPVEGRCEQWFDHIFNLLSKEEASIEVITPEEHDHFVSIVQGLTHFAYITIGTTMQKLDFDVKGSRRFMSPVYDIMLDFVGRILGQNPELYALIQMENPEVLRVHDTFIERCKHFSSIVRSHDTGQFCEEMKAAALHFGDTPSALRRSDKLINSKVAEFEELVHSTGQERGLLHIYSRKIHVGIVKKVTSNNVILEEGKKELHLKIGNIKLLSEDELNYWKENKFKPTLRDISVFIPRSARPFTIQQILDCRRDGVKVETIDTYLHKKGPSATFRLNIRGDLDACEIQRDMEELLEGMGCSLRN
jgi:prephenate dehydrogenase